VTKVAHPSLAAISPSTTGLVKRKEIRQTKIVPGGNRSRWRRAAARSSNSGSRSAASAFTTKRNSSRPISPPGSVWVYRTRASRNEPVPQVRPLGPPGAAAVRLGPGRAGQMARRPTRTDGMCVHVRVPPHQLGHDRFRDVSTLFLDEVVVSTSDAHVRPPNLEPGDSQRVSTHTPQACAAQPSGVAAEGEPDRLESDRWSGCVLQYQVADVRERGLDVLDCTAADGAVRLDDRGRVEAAARASVTESRASDTSPPRLAR
jgi:hypothetical protein